MTRRRVGKARAAGPGVAISALLEPGGLRIRDTPRTDRLMAVLLALCSVLLGLIVIALLTGSGRAGPLPHPEFGPMQTGVDAGELGAPAWASYVAGIAVLGAMWVVMLIGLRRGHWIHRAVNAWMVGYVFLFVILMWTFGVYAAGETTILLGFTAPTSLLVYGLGLAPWIPLLAITRAFEDAYFGPGHQARFDAILAEAKDRRRSPPGGGN